MDKYKKDILLTGIVIIGILFLLGTGLSYFYLSYDAFEHKGGTRLVIRVVTDEAVTQQLDRNALSILQELKSKDISLDSSLRGEGFSIDVNGINLQERQTALGFLNETFGQSYEIRSMITQGKADFRLSLKESEIHNIRESAVRQTMNTIRRRLSEFGISKPRLRLQDENNRENQDQIVVEFPSVEDPGRLKSLIGNTAQLKICLVKKEGGGPFSSIEDAYEANSEALDEYRILSYIGDPGRGAAPEYMVVRKDPVITGNDFKKVRPSRDSNGNPAVAFYLKSEGSELFARTTSEHIGENLAIILDDKVYSYPTIQARISGEGIITGNFTRQAANDLALLLSTGALPASIQILQESYVPPAGD